jgi:hypothetical protein
MESFLSRTSSSDQAIWSLGLGFEPIVALALGPVRALPKGSFGLEYREHNPDHGLGAFLGIGATVDVWVSRHVSLGVGIERRYSYPGNDKTLVGFTVRFASDKLIAIIPEE